MLFYPAFPHYLLPFCISGTSFRHCSLAFAFLPAQHLRCGVQGTSPREVSLNGVLRGSIPLQRPLLGRCVIRGVGPSLWFSVADLLGFEIAAAVFPTGSPFCKLMAKLYPNTEFVNRLPGGFLPPDLVMIDDTALPGFGNPYWTTVTCPHLIAHKTGSTTPVGPLPPGWSL